MAASPPTGVTAIVQHPGWKAVGSAVAPATVIFAASAYCAGYTQRVTTLTLNELPSDIIQGDLQSIMARGYLAEVMVGLPLLIAAAVPVAIIFGVAHWRRKKATAANRVSRFDTKLRSIGNLASPGGSMFWLNIIYIISTFGVICGGVSAYYSHAVMKFQLSSRGMHLVSLHSRRGTAQGIVIDSDKDRMIFRSNSAIYVIKNDDVLSLTPHKSRD